MARNVTPFPGAREGLHRERGESAILDGAERDGAAAEAEMALHPSALEPDIFERRTGIAAADFELLRGHALFQEVEDHLIRASLAFALAQRYDRGTVLFLRGQQANHFYIVLDGWVKLFRDSVEGHESVIGVFARGESFAEAAVANMKVYPVSAMAVTEARLLTIPGDKFMQMVREHPALAINFTASVAAHLHGLVRQVEALSGKSTTQRLAAFLVSLSDAREGPTTVALPLDKSLIAARLGMQPETLSRSLAKLRRVGVDAATSEVRIADVRLLRDVGEGLKTI